MTRNEELRKERRKLKSKNKARTLIMSSIKKPRLT